MDALIDVASFMLTSGAILFLLLPFFLKIRHRIREEIIISRSLHKAHAPQ